MNCTHTDPTSQEVRARNRGGTGFRNRGNWRPGSPPRVPPRIPPRTRYGSYYRGGGSPYLIEPSLIEPSLIEPGRDASGPASELIRWAQECLNRTRQLRLPVDGVADAATRSAVRNFQSQQGLPATGILGPDTVDAMRSACTTRAAAEYEVSHTAEEVPAVIGKAVAGLPASVIPPRFADRGTLEQAIAFHKGRADPGLYVIRFTVNGQEQGYTGKAENLAKRLMQHRLCAQMLGLSTAQHRVMTAPYPTSEAVRRGVEKRINDYVRAHHPGMFTNQRRELEVAVLGESWN